jgi:hypothetical protein
MRFEHAANCDTTLNQSKPNLSTHSVLQTKRSHHWDQSYLDHLLPFEQFDVTNPWLSYGFMYLNLQSHHKFCEPKTALAILQATQQSLSKDQNRNYVGKHNSDPVLIWINFEGQFGNPMLAWIVQLRIVERDCLGNLDWRTPGSINFIHG